MDLQACSGRGACYRGGGDVDGVRRRCLRRPGGKRLPVDIDADRFNRLVRFPVPAFVIGVDLVTEASFLVAADRGRRARVPGITRAYPLADDRVKIGLYREVSAFWAAHKSLRTRTGFRDV